MKQCCMLSIVLKYDPQENGVMTENFVARNLGFAEKSEQHEYHVKMAAGSLYAG